MIEKFKQKTKKYFRKIAGYTAEEIEEYVLKLIEDALTDTDVIIKNVAVYGSRSRGMESLDSDIDILLEYESKTVREDTLFNWLNELHISIGGIMVDINPIREQETGTMEEYLTNAEIYMKEKINNKEGINMMMIREFKDDNGKVLCGADLGEHHASVKEAMKNFYTFENYIDFLNRYFEEENVGAVRSQKVSTTLEKLMKNRETYDKHVAESHLNDAAVQEYVKKYPDKLEDPLGNYQLPEVAEVYYALANGVEPSDIDVMINKAENHKNMRVIRMGYENGLGKDVLLYADLKDEELQRALMAGLSQGVDKKCVEMMRKAHTCVTVHVVWNGMRKGLSMEDASFLLDTEQSIVREREKYYDALNDTEIDTYTDMLTLLTVCMTDGKEAAKELAQTYIEGIKYHAGMEYTVRDAMITKKHGRTK